MGLRNNNCKFDIKKNAKKREQRIAKIGLFGDDF